MKQSSFNPRYNSILIILAVTLVVVSLIATRYGAVSLTLDEIFSALGKFFSGNDNLTLNENIFMQIRLPRAILCLFTGASLAVGGVLMQALFRNPIVEPGLVGTSSGAAFGASLYFVLGAALNLKTGSWSLPLIAFIGGIIATYLVFMFSESKHSGKSSVISLLLTGIAVNAVFMSGVGFMSYIARDPQARSITFWNLGTLSGANWHSVTIVGTSTVICIAIALRYSRQLNALMIGEDEAKFLGVNIKRLKLIILTINVALVAIATAFTGVISFVGLIVPHILRIMKGSDNRYLILGSTIMGALLLTAADLIARVALMPAELPIGIVTSIVGAPVFIILLRRKDYFF